MLKHNALPIVSLIPRQNTNGVTVYVLYVFTTEHRLSSLTLINVVHTEICVVPTPCISSTPSSSSSLPTSSSFSFSSYLSLSSPSSSSYSSHSSHSSTFYNTYYSPPPPLSPSHFPKTNTTHRGGRRLQLALLKCRFVN